MKKLIAQYGFIIEDSTGEQVLWDANVAQHIDLGVEVNLEGLNFMEAIEVVVDSLEDN